MPPLRPILLLLLSTTVAAQDAKPPAFQGLPAGARIDDDRVLDARYGASGGASNGAKAKPLAGAMTSGPARLAQVDGAIATVWIEKSGRPGPQDKTPVTFGQVFAPGAVPRSMRLAGKLADGDAVALQVDAKARHPDGSLRHAVISAITPAPLERPVALGLVSSSKAPASPANDATLAALPPGLTATVKAVIDGQPYAASLHRRLLAGAKPAAWLSGPVAQEWQVGVPLTSPAGVPHPHLMARFALRWYPALDNARIDVIVENNWAFEPNPQNVTYDAEITVGDKPVYTKPGLEHYHHARWRKVFWWRGDPGVVVRHDPDYLIATRAVPNYDRSVRVSGAALADMFQAWTGPKTEPMGVGQANKGMPTTGGRPDIGLLPGWAVMYLLSMDQRAREITMGTADLAGSWSIHYRDRHTGLPVSIMDFPYMTLIGTPGDTRNPATGKSEAFPPCPRREACATPNQHDSAHQPNFAYLPYLLTGDHYYLEELQFWAMLNAFAGNPGYRQHRKGLLQSDQVRGQAWSLRTLAETTYITPDAHPLKPHFRRILDSNLDWYSDTYLRKTDANTLGVIVNGHALGYRKGTGLAPWQDDFFTSALGHASDLGFDKADALLAWKARFPVERMIGEGSCWVTATMYDMVVRERPNAPFFSSIAAVFQASHPPELRGLACGSPEMASALKIGGGEMAGYAHSVVGYPSNLQPALAYAADVLGERGRKAWRKFMARPVKPNYAAGPQFAIVPRGDTAEKADK